MSGIRTYETAGGVFVQEQTLGDGTIIKIITAPDGETVVVTERPDGSVETSDSLQAPSVELPQSPLVATPQPQVTLNSPKEEPFTSNFKLKSVEYPLTDNQNKSRHFVRFFINLNEESKIIRSKSVDYGEVDQSDQNRVNNSGFDQDNATALLGTATGVQVGASVAGGIAARPFSKSLSKFKGKGVAIAGGLLSGAAAAGLTTLALESGIIDITKKLKRLKSSITLYMPAGINVNYRMAYETTGDQLAELLSGDKGADLAAALAKEGITTPAAEIGREFTRIVATAASDTVQLLTRNALNRKVDVLFKRVDNRTFNFEFDFYPKTSEEAFAVAEIIYQFKLYSHPEIIDGLEQYLFLYPAEFDIEYGIRDENGNERQNVFLNKISSCVLAGMNVNYGASGGSFQSLKNGEPIHCKLTLQFTEIETLHRGRIEAGL